MRRENPTSQRSVWGRLAATLGVTTLALALAGCYELRTTVTIESLENVTLTHEHVADPESLGGSEQDTRNFVDNTYPDHSGENTERNGYVGKKFTVSGVDAINAFRSDTNDNLQITFPQVDGQTVMRLSLTADLRDTDAEGYRPAQFSVRIPSRWAYRVITPGGGQAVLTDGGLTIVAPEQGFEWTPIVQVTPPALRLLDEGDDSDAAAAEPTPEEAPEEPDYEVLEPDADPSGTEEPDGAADDFGDLGDTGDFGDIGFDPDGEPDFEALYPEDGSSDTALDVGDFATAAGEQEGRGSGLWIGIGAGFGLGGLIAAGIVLAARARRAAKPADASA